MASDTSNTSFNTTLILALKLWSLDLSDAIFSKNSATKYAKAGDEISSGCVISDTVTVRVVEFVFPAGSVAVYVYSTTESSNLNPKCHLYG